MTLKKWYIVVVLAWALVGCMGRELRPLRNDGGAETLWSHRYQYVRIEPRERCGDPATPANSHPGVLDSGQLKAALASLRIEKYHEETTIPVFSKTEMATVTGPLAQAFQRATPEEDVVLAIEGSHPGAIGYQRSMTTARLFLRPGELHVIFGDLHAKLDDYDSPLHIEPTDRRLSPFLPGSRCTDVGTAFPAIIPTGAVRFHEQAGIPRRNWLVVNLAHVPGKSLSTGDRGFPLSHSVPEAVMPPEKKPSRQTVAPSPGVTRHGGIEEKLQLLKRLREKDLITEQEYNEKKRKLLDRYFK